MRRGSVIVICLLLAVIFIWLFILTFRVFNFGAVENPEVSPTPTTVTPTNVTQPPPVTFTPTVTFTPSNTAPTTPSPTLTP